MKIKKGFKVKDQILYNGLAKTDNSFLMNDNKYFIK